MPEKGSVTKTIEKGSVIKLPGNKAKRKNEVTKITG